mgnify:FL=1
MTRQFERLAVGANWNPDDPYQYKLISPNVAGTLANFGVIAFNPSGANYSEQTPYGQRAFSALLSYAVLDWHILRDDREVPSPESRVPAGSGDVGVATVRTTLPNIRPTGDEDADGNPYRGLYDTDPTTGPDIQVFNLENPNGVPLNGGDYTEPLDASFDYWVRRDRGGSYQSGIIYINTDRVRAGTPLRILYKAQGDWAVALQKAVSDYRYSGGVRPAVNQAASFGADGNRLYFHRTELNKAAVVTIEYVQGGEVVRLPSRQFTIDNADGAYAWVDVTRIAPQITAAGVTGWNVHGNIHGVSVKTRVIWKDNQTFRNPWRVQDLESIIPQAPPTL